MALKTKHIAVVCNYKLLENRVGGMDYFFWAFNTKCLAHNIKVDWFFPNTGTHGKYQEFNIIASHGLTIERNFLNHIEQNTTQYTHVITHFVELCTSFFAKLKKQIQFTTVS